MTPHHINDVVMGLGHLAALNSTTNIRYRELRFSEKTSESDF
jgi:hypothetical protein